MHKQDFSVSEYSLSDFNDLLETHSIQQLLCIKKNYKNITNAAEKFFFQGPSETSLNLKLKAWFLLPKHTSAIIKFEDIAKQSNLFPINKELKQQAIQALLFKNQSWRLSCLKFWGILLQDTDSFEQNLLHLACINSHLELAKQLIQSKFDLIFQVDKDGKTPLHLAIQAEKPNVELIKLLINYGSDTSFKDKNGNTPLHAAILAKNPNREIIQLLIERTPDLCDRNCEGNTPLHTAILASNTHFEEFKNVVIEQLIGNNGAEIAEKNLERLKFFINNPFEIHQVDIHGHFPIINAVRDQKPDLNFIEILIKMGANVNQPDAHGNSPLLRAILNNPPNLNLVEFLIENGANVNLPNSQGNTPLIRALFKKPTHLKLVELLIDKGASVNQTDFVGDHALYKVILQKAPDLKLIELLIDKGANVNLPNSEGKPPLRKALFKTTPNLKLVELLIDKGANLSQMDADGNPPLNACILQKTPDLKLIEFLIDKGADVNQPNSKGRPPLHSALFKQSPNLKLVELLIEKGADLSQLDADGDPPLHACILQKSPDLKLIELLIDKGADVNQPNSDNYPLHLALNRNPPNLALIQLLIRKRADLYSPNRQGLTCAWLFRVKGININKPKLSDYDKEHKAKQLLANSWSIKQKNSFGFDSRFGLKKNIKLLREFKDHFSTYDLKKICNEIKNSHGVSKEDPAIIAKKYLMNETILFQSGWKKHAVIVIFYKNYLLICNRGEERQISSIKTYRIVREKNNPLTKEDILNIKRLSDLNSVQGAEFLYHTLPAKLGFKQSDLIGKFMDEYCLQSSQKMGNCWWVSPKTGVLAMLIMQSLTEIDAKPLGEEEKINEFKKAFAAMVIVYKAYSEFARIKLLKEYLQRPDNDEEKHHKLVKAVYIKFRIKDWQYAFGNDSPEVKEMMENFVGSLDDKEFPKLHSKKEIEDLFKKYRKQYLLNKEFVPINAWD